MSFGILYQCLFHEMLFLTLTKSNLFRVQVKPPESSLKLPHFHESLHHKSCFWSKGNHLCLQEYVSNPVGKDYYGVLFSVVWLGYAPIPGQPQWPVEPTSQLRLQAHSDSGHKTPGWRVKQEWFSYYVILFMLFSLLLDCNSLLEGSVSNLVTCSSKHCVKKYF